MLGCVAMGADTGAGSVGDDFPALVKALGIAGSLFFSLITLVVTLVALSFERSPVKRYFLKLCAGISAAVMIIEALLLVGVSSGYGGG